jgi:gliding motility-associated-like protein
MIMARGVIISFLLLLSAGRIAAQKCPENIGFELGNFSGWQCSEGTITQNSGETSFSSTIPTIGRHTMLANSNVQELDGFGNFPINCPNGSGYSIMLGNASTGRQAESISYTFTIPADQNNYSIIYNYAVVFQNPSHPPNQQPKFTANVYDENSNTYIGCSSFTYTASSNLPGFKSSDRQPDVFYKDWTPVTIKLSGYAGKTIRLEFTTYDCSQGGHFGYAYVDVNQNCTSPISGNVFCSKTDKLTLVAPFGFQDYHWYSGDFSTLLGQQSKLEFKPLPQPNTKYALIITPYPEQGCVDTLYTTAMYSPEPLEFSLNSNLAACIEPGADITSADVTAGSGSNLSFTYYTDATLTKFVNVPKQLVKSGEYYVMAENVSGCTEIKPVQVHIEPLPKFTVTDPPRVFRPMTVDLSTLKKPENNVDYNYTYWRDSLTTNEIRLPQFVDQTGRYFIKGSSQVVASCATTHPVNIKILDPNIFVPNAFSPNSDGSNDEWRIPQLAYYPEATVEVFNRTGRVVYRSLPGYGKPWNGTTDGKPLPVATYYYIIRLNGELPLVSGSVTIVR